MKRFRQDQNYTQDHIHKDPVCGMQISSTTAIEVCDYKRKTYYFCAAVCREAFEADPGKYISLHRQHGVKPGTQDVQQHMDISNDHNEERQ